MYTYRVLKMIKASPMYGLHGGPLNDPLFLGNSRTMYEGTGQHTKLRIADTEILVGDHT